MIYQRIDVSLKKEEVIPELAEILSRENGSSNASLEVIIPLDRDEGFDARKPSRAIVVTPGGGYGFLANREADPVAIKFLDRNYATFILHYSIHRKYPIPQLEMLKALIYIREHSEELHIDPEKIGLIGFSAGGHLVASYSALCERKELRRYMKNIPCNVKPNVIALSYPVISLQTPTHGGTRDIIAGEDQYLRDLLSVDEQVTEDYPPTFIWMTKEDDQVPVSNIDKMTAALEKNNVYHCSITYPHLWHGLSVCSPYFDDIPKDREDDYKQNREWITKMFDFFETVI